MDPYTVKNYFIWLDCCLRDSRCKLLFLRTETALFSAKLSSLLEMARDSSIEWTHHTFNPWWGCAKVSPACRNCYAEMWAKRVGQDVWGSKNDRRFFTDTHWGEPLKWNREATAANQRKRVFCASMADVFERRAVLNPWRERLWDLITATPMLDWLLLTKRPQNIEAMTRWSVGQWPANVWLGATVENQHWADVRMHQLLQHDSRVRFLSCEPLLGPVDLSQWIGGNQSIDWVIAGGESGAKARPMNPAWVRSLRDQCNQAGIAFHFKQWGHWAPKELQDESPKVVHNFDGVEMIPLGKKKAGRELDGCFWDELPLRLTG